MTLIPAQVTLVPVHGLAASVSSFSSFHCWLWLCLIFIDLLWLAGFSVLENDFARIVDDVTFVWIVLSEVVRASFAWFVEIELIWSLTLVLSLIFWLSFFYRIFRIFFFGLIYIFHWASFDFVSSTSRSFCWTTFSCIRAPRLGNIDRCCFFVFDSQTSLYFWFVFGSIYRWIDLKSKGIFNRYQLRQFFLRFRRRWLTCHNAVIILSFLINPLQRSRTASCPHISILHNLPHLSIQKGISNYQFFLLQFLLETFSFER